MKYLKKKEKKVKKLKKGKTSKQPVQNPEEIRTKDFFDCVAPGVVLTDMCANVDPATMKDLASQASLGRNGTPQDIAKAILYLADAPFVTGQVLGVNGGLIF